MIDPGTKWLTKSSYTLPMSESSADKTMRWRRRIEECRAEAKSQLPEGREAIASIIESYERLIALVERCAK
jgi:hypothetical protein